MFRTLRRARPQAGVRFCDGCATVSTPDQRVATRIERTRTRLTALTGPR
ncbi:hypothetical protein [Dactylosporangium darangshiense]|jgi:hypothetical protein|uniref:Uncharacterized protein n=1 Tax=Dactylosporangium darangshiense TaxID=579108 RepID=A0ABP8D7S8_9ACTN|nr:hypothetical protein [Dactylosporangium sp.]